MIANLFIDNTESAYDMIYIDSHGVESIILGQIELPDEVATWAFWQIATKGMVPTVLGIVRGINPNGQITLNSKLPGFDFAGKPFIKMRLRYGMPVVPIAMGPDWCKKCEVRGEFKRCALKCPKCGSFLGGC